MIFNYEDFCWPEKQCPCGDSRLGCPVERSETPFTTVLQNNALPPPAPKRSTMPKCLVAPAQEAVKCCESLCS
jgi:hypothetical protein